MYEGPANTNCILGLLAAILNDGTSPNTGFQLLKPETVKGSVHIHIVLPPAINRLR